MGKRYTQFLPTQSKKVIDTKTQCNEQHIRISRSMLYSEAFLGLNAREIHLYMILRLKFYKEEETNIDFAFSKSLGVKIFKLSANSENVIKNALKGLVTKGFLDRTYNSNGGGKNNKIPNRYKFSTRWKEYKTEYLGDKRYKKTKKLQG